MRGTVKRLIDEYIKNGGNRNREAIIKHLIEAGFTPSIGEEYYIATKTTTLIYRG